LGEGLGKRLLGERPVVNRRLSDHRRQRL
jgi:hypothetical protein